MSVSFTVHGRAQPAGSKRGFYRGGRVVIADANEKARPWKAIVSDAALQHHDGPPLRGPLQVTLAFVERRPSGHFNRQGGLNANGLRNPFPAKRPDLLKLARGVEDALTGIVYADDSQIVIETLTKIYGKTDYVVVAVDELAVPAVTPRGAVQIAAQIRLMEGGTA